MKKRIKISELRKMMNEGIDKFVNKLPTTEEEKREILNYFNKFKDVKVNWHQQDKEQLLIKLRDIMATHTSKTHIKKQVKQQGAKGLPDDQYIKGIPIDNFDVYIPLTHLASKMIASEKIGSQVGEWCVAGNKVKDWNTYVKSQIVVLMFVHQKTGIKYILGYNTNDGKKEFADNENNHEITPPFDLNKVIELNKKKIEEAGEILFIEARYNVAMRHNDIESVKYFLQNKAVDPSINDKLGIDWAAQEGYYEIAELLLQDGRVDPSEGKNRPIRVAAYRGYYKIVELLLQDKRVDPTASVAGESAIETASEEGHHEIVKLLLQDVRVKNSLTDEEYNKYVKETGLNINEQIKQRIMKQI